MSIESNVTHDGTNFTAGVDLSAAQFKAVAISGARTVGLASTGAVMYGILQNKPTAGQAADIAVMGMPKALAGAAYSAGVLLMVDATSRLVLATSTNISVATAIEASTGVGQICQVAIIPNGRLVP
jgi:hypothetical protein